MNRLRGDGEEAATSPLLLASTAGQESQRHRTHPAHRTPSPPRPARGGAHRDAKPHQREADGGLIQRETAALTWASSSDQWRTDDDKNPKVQI